jgi:small-conductance mechanosensitive channel
MPLVDVVNATFLGNSLRAWMTAGIVFAIVVLVLLVVRRVLVVRLAIIAQRTATDIDDVLVDLLRNVRAYFVYALALAAAAQALVLPANVHPWINRLALTALVFQVGVWGNALIAYAIHHWQGKQEGAQVSSTTLNAFAIFLRVVLWAILILFGLNAAGLPVTSLITGLGIGGVAVALALQNILGDLFAALSIVIDKPFDVGDPISVDAMAGTVEHIGLKSTRVRSVDGEQIVVGNADLLRSRLRNFRRMRERRVLFTLGLNYETPPDVTARIPAVIREIISQVPKARFDRCHFVRFEASALVFEIVYWVTTPDYLDFRDTLHAINLAILARFEKEGIEFAFQTHTVHVRSVWGESDGTSAVAVRAAGATAAPAPPSST